MLYNLVFSPQTLYNNQCTTIPTTKTNPLFSSHSSLTVSQVLGDHILFSLSVDMLPLDILCK